MEQYIHKYLTDNYKIETSQVGNDGIYRITDKYTHNAPIYGDKLLKEIISIFGVDETELMVYIHLWSITVNPNVNLEFYWKTHKEVLDFPRVATVHARTIAQDLVSVQPMEKPSGTLLLMSMDLIRDEESNYQKLKKIFEISRQR